MLNFGSFNCSSVNSRRSRQKSSPKVHLLNGPPGPPVEIQAQGLPGGTAQIKGSVSSQFLSAILMAAPGAQKDVTLKITDKIHLYTDSFTFFVLPLGLMTLAAFYFEKLGRRGLSGRIFARQGLILSALVYYSLNFVFFGFPWATLPMVGRHTNNWIFLRCTELLIFGALVLGRRDSPLEIEESTTAMLAQDS